MSGTSASKRVKPISASTSRRRWSWITLAMASVSGGERQISVGSRRAWKSGSIGTSSPKPSGCGEQRVELDLLDGPLGDLAALELVDRLKHVVVAEAGELQRATAGTLLA